VQAALLGTETLMISGLGDDIYGTTTVANFQRVGVDASLVKIAPGQSSGVAQILVDGQGRNVIVIVNGANDALTVQDVTGGAVAGAIRSAGMVVAQLELGVEVSLAALEVARAVGVPTLLNTAPARASLPEALYRATTILCSNETETQMLTGIDPSQGSDEAARAAAVLMERIGGNTVLLTLGEQGCLVLERGGKPVHLPAPKVEKVVDTTGAGDSWIGAFAHKTLLGVPAVEAAAWANKCAAISVQKKGSQVSYADKSHPELK
jgi:ribokinase